MVTIGFGAPTLAMTTSESIGLNACLIAGMNGRSAKFLPMPLCPNSSVNGKMAVMVACLFKSAIRKKLISDIRVCSMWDCICCGGIFAAMLARCMMGIFRFSTQSSRLSVTRRLSRMSDARMFRSVSVKSTRLPRASMINAGQSTKNTIRLTTVSRKEIVAVLKRKAYPVKINRATRALAMPFTACLVIKNRALLTGKSAKT